MDNYQFLEKLKKLPFVDAVYLFGSRARGDFHEKSDIDLAVVCPSANSGDWLVVQEILENAPILNQIDAVRYDTLKDGLFKHKIDEDKKVLYAKN